MLSCKTFPHWEQSSASFKSWHGSLTQRFCSDVALAFLSDPSNVTLEWPRWQRGLRGNSDQPNLCLTSPLEKFACRKGIRASENHKSSKSFKPQPTHYGWYQLKVIRPSLSLSLPLSPLPCAFLFSMLYYISFPLSGGMKVFWCIVWAQRQLLKVNLSCFRGMCLISAANIVHGETRRESSAVPDTSNKILHSTSSH